MYQSDVRRAAEGCVAAVLPAVAIIVVLTLMRPAVSAEHETAGNFGERAADTVYDVWFMLRQAEQGDARAAFVRGTRFASGRGAARDDGEAFRWFEQAAEGGLAEAQL